MDLSATHAQTQTAAPAQRDPLWYKDAIIYQLHIKAFFDSNNDGVGDFPGLTQKLDYLQDLGIDTIWVLPFYPSPMRDDGYDIADYRGVYADYGNLGDVRTFIREAHARNIKIITELVINHTSDQHPWFQAARRAPPGSNKRNFYVWSDTDKKWPETRIIFSDTETSNWTWDPVAGAYYWHRFFSHQPDLNFNNPSVIKAVMRIMRYWLDMGVDGMRLDAIPYLCERDGTINENLPETHAVLRYMRAELDKHYSDRFFLAEANQWPEDVREYFGDGDECQMAYHFPLMPRIYMAVAQEDRHPITDIMAQTPDIPENCQWAIFLRNHDELTLEMVTARERDYMYQTYAADKRMRINVGIRRRLAPLMENNRDKIKLVKSILLSMPGSPILYYGDEIGMGDNVYLGDRNGVRTPMQWSPDRNAGFSRADPARLYLPPVMDAVYGYQAVNVEAQINSPSSLLNWMRRLIAVRKAHSAFGRGSLSFLHPGNRKILAYLREYRDETLLCVANLSSSSQPVELDLSAFKGRVPVELLGLTVFPSIGELPYFLTLPGFSFYWFLLSTEAAAPAWHDERWDVSELPVLVIPEGWGSLLGKKANSASALQNLLANKMRSQFEQQILPAFLANQRWFADKGRPAHEIALVAAGEWKAQDGDWLIAMVRFQTEQGEQHYYGLPLALAWEDENSDNFAALARGTVARVRQRARSGILYDAVWDDAFCRALATALANNAVQELVAGSLHFQTPTEVPPLLLQASQEIRRAALEQSNTSIIFGDRYILKIYRKLQSGVNPEIEMAKFLTLASPFEHIAAYAGAIEFHSKDGKCASLGILQRYVENQGNGWAFCVDYLQRYLESISNLPGVSAPETTHPHAIFLGMITVLGERSAKLHQALSRVTGNPDFDPEDLSTVDLARWRTDVAQLAALAFNQLSAQQANLPASSAATVAELLGLKDGLRPALDALLPQSLQGQKTRFHGDYHLAQVLVVKNDFVITDFEGEPGRSLAERRRKDSPLRDVAGMLRSFNYAAETVLNHFALDQSFDMAKLEPEVRRWEALTRDAFLESYCAGVHCGDSSMRAETDTLIEFFTLEKAVYELLYELNNRPEWVALPARGLAQILNKTKARTESQHE